MKKLFYVTIVAIVVTAILSTWLGYSQGYHNGREEVCIIRTVEP